MTAQISDQFIIKEKEYTLVAISAPIGFDPRMYGIVPKPICSACWRGYWCIYEMFEKGLFLKDLYISSENNNYPPVNGVSPCSKSKDRAAAVAELFHPKYKNINMPIDFTGKILVGNDFINDYYINMGYQRSLGYKNLKELIFDNGILTDTIDHSDLALQMREEISRNLDKSDNDLYEYIPHAVNECFSEALRCKAWWIK